MKKPKRVRRKARFYKGQVVAKCLSGKTFGKECVSGYGSVKKFDRREKDDGWLLAEGGGWWYDDILSRRVRMYTRPLTAKEIGPRSAGQ